jgi:predicted transcriptional regulator
MSQRPAIASNITVAADIVAAYVSHNPVPLPMLTGLIADVHQALLGLRPASPPGPVPLVPAVPVKRSIQPDYIICLEDGMKFKSLKRHLKSSYDMTPDEYRSKWNLPGDYPMVAPNYAAKRSELAKGIGLGRVIGGEPFKRRNGKKAATR